MNRPDAMKEFVEQLETLIQKVMLKQLYIDKGLITKVQRMNVEIKEQKELMLKLFFNV